MDEPLTQIRPLRRMNPGAWKSRDGRWAFLRHESDPDPKRWYAFLDDDDWPSNEGCGHVRLQDVADWAQREAAIDPEVAELLRAGPPESVG